MPETSEFALSAALVETIGMRVEKGSYPDVVAVAEGIPRTVVSRWLKRGHDLEQEGVDPDERLHPLDALCLALVRRVEQAEAICEISWMEAAAVQARIGKRGTTVYVEMLGRRFPDRWRKRELMQGRGPGARSIEQALKDLQAERGAES